jgi:uncharacterized membrane protein
MFPRVIYLCDIKPLHSTAIKCIIIFSIVKLMWNVPNKKTCKAKIRIRSNKTEELELVKFAESKVCLTREYCKYDTWRAECDFVP